MKRITLALLTLALVTATAPGGQATVKPRVGIKAGLSIADQTWEYARVFGNVDRDHRTGLAFGVFGDLDLAPSVALRGEALYVQRGSQIEVTVMTYTGPAGTMVFKDRIDYVSLLATIKLQPLERVFKPYFFAGPRIDIKVGDQSPFDDEVTGDLFDSYESTIPGITVGIGFQQQISRLGTVMLEFRHDFNLADAAKLVTDENELVIKNKGSLFLVGVRF